jgi:phosphoesterase family protein/cellulase (glycosyl hydrolase family 5)
MGVVRDSTKEMARFHAFVSRNARMRRWMPGRHTFFLPAVVIVGLLVAACATTTPQGGASGGNIGNDSGSAAVPALKHVFVIPMENESQGALIGNSAAPYINSLAKQYGVAAQFYGTAHPSLPNYFEMTAGSTFGVTSDCNTCYQNQTNIVDQLEAKGLTWRAYAEDVPSACYIGGDTGAYSKHHNPFVYYDDIRTNPARCKNIVPETSFASDMASGSAPNLVWYTPNLIHDMHNSGVGVGDAFLRSFIPSILSSAAYTSGPSAIFIVWDESAKSDTSGCCGGLAHGGHTLALVISNVGKQGYTSQTPYYHASLLLSIEQAFGLGTLNDTANAATRPMSDFFTGTTASAPNTPPTIGATTLPTPATGNGGSGSCAANSPYGFTTYHGGNHDYAYNSTLVAEYKQLSVCWVRFQFHGDLIETSPGVYNWSLVDQAVATMNAAGIHITFALQQLPLWDRSLICPVDSVHYAAGAAEMARYAQQAATRYNGRNGHGVIDAFEIGNEEYDNHYTGSMATTEQCRSAAMYGPVLKAVYLAIKAVYPTALVGTQGFWWQNTPHVQTTWNTLFGSYSQYFDYANFHYYQDPPNVAHGSTPSFADEIQLIHQAAVAHGQSNKPIWVTEVGFDNTDPVAQSNNLQYVLDQARTSGVIKKVFLFTINYGTQVKTIYPPTGPLPAFFMLQRYVAQYLQW